MDKEFSDDWHLRPLSLCSVDNKDNDWAGEFLKNECCEAREALRADFAQGGVLRLASKSLVKALVKLSSQVSVLYFNQILLFVDLLRSCTPLVIVNPFPWLL